MLCSSSIAGDEVSSNFNHFRVSCFRHSVPRGGVGSRGYDELQYFGRGRDRDFGRTYHSETSPRQQATSIQFMFSQTIYLQGKTFGLPYHSLLKIIPSFHPRAHYKLERKLCTREEKWFLGHRHHDSDHYKCVVGEYFSFFLCLSFKELQLLSLSRGVWHGYQLVMLPLLSEQRVGFLRLKLQFALWVAKIASDGLKTDVKCI